MCACLCRLTELSLDTRTTFEWNPANLPSLGKLSLCIKSNCAVADSVLPVLSHLRVHMDRELAASAAACIAAVRAAARAAQRPALSVSFEMRSLRDTADLLLRAVADSGLSVRELNLASGASQDATETLLRKSTVATLVVSLPYGWLLDVVQQHLHRIGEVLFRNEHFSDDSWVCLRRIDFGLPIALHAAGARVRFDPQCLVYGPELGVTDSPTPSAERKFRERMVNERGLTWAALFATVRASGSCDRCRRKLGSSF